MKLSQLKEILNQINEVNFALPNGLNVPEHFHVTEVGQIDKKLYRLRWKSQKRGSYKLAVVDC